MLLLRVRPGFAKTMEDLSLRGGRQAVFSAMKTRSCRRPSRQRAMARAWLFCFEYLLYLTLAG